MSQFFLMLPISPFCPVAQGCQLFRVQKVWQGMFKQHRWLLNSCLPQASLLCYSPICMGLVGLFPLGNEPGQCADFMLFMVFALKRQRLKGLLISGVDSSEHQVWLVGAGTSANLPSSCTLVVTSVSCSFQLCNVFFSCFIIIWSSPDLSITFSPSGKKNKLNDQPTRGTVNKKNCGA